MMYYFILKALFVLETFKCLIFSPSFLHFPESKEQVKVE